MPSLLQRFARIAPYFRHGRLGLVVAGLGSLVAALTEPMIPALLKPLLDKGFSAGALPLWTVPVAIIGLFTLRGAAGFVAQYALTWAAQRGVQQLRDAMFARLLDAQPVLYTQRTASSLANTLIYEVQKGAQLLVSSMLTLIRDSLTLLALLVYLLWLNWKLTLFVAVLLPAVGLLMRVIGKRLHELTRSQIKAVDELAYVVEENVLAWRIVRLHGAQQQETSRFEAASQRLRRIVQKAVAASATITPLTQVMAAMSLSAVIVAALWQSAGAPGATVGGFVAFVTAMLMLVAPIRHLSDVMTPVVTGLASIERGVDLVERSAVEQGGGHAVDRAQGAIELIDVSVRYREGEAPALEGLSLSIRPGESVALVGPSGAGKSTLINLLPRFVSPTSGEMRLDGIPLAQWDVRALVGPSGAGKSTLINLLPRFVSPTSGEIRLDGIPLAQWDVQALRRQFALVSQDVVLFNDSIAANVALGQAPDADRVRAALRGANLLDHVDGLPQGADTVVGHNGSQLSGGQRQRLAIARAIYKDAPVLILDEATSALDNESERAVQQALETLMRGRTTIVIAHRLSTIEHADRIVVMEGGRVVEQGPHAQLRDAGGLYARLHAMQFRT